MQKKNQNVHYFVWQAYHGVVRTSLVEDVSDQMLLAVVRGQDADLLRRVSH